MKREAYIVPALVLSDVLEVAQGVPPLDEVLEELIIIQDALPEEELPVPLTVVEKLQKAALLIDIRTKKTGENVP